MGMQREIIRIDEEKCDGCGLCVPGCAEGAIRIVDGKARIVADKYCDGLGACLGHCPQGALSIEVREAEAFDEQAVEALLATGQPVHAAASAEQFSGCPSANVTTLSPCEGFSSLRIRPDNDTSASALSHWPVQIRLVPPDAPFLQDADLLLTADCVAVALPDFHSRWLPGRVVLMGCPKFDDAESYVERLSALFQTTSIRSLTVLEMEVPCCANMSRIVAKAVARAGVTLRFERVVISCGGQVVGRETS